VTAVREGIWAAVLTPVNERLEPDALRATEYYGELLANGCDGLNVLGTTGEAMSLGAAARARFMEALAESYLPNDRIMIGTGAAALDDAASLTARAFDLGYAAALVMPPFYYRDAGVDGILRYFDALFERVSPPSGRILLYNFPAMSGIAFRGELLARLMDEFGACIGGMKDSSNDVELLRDATAAFPALRVFPSSEASMIEASADGASGCISATVALSPQLASAVWQHRDPRSERELARRRGAVTGFPLIPALRWLVARERDDAAWERPLPPLAPLSPEQRAALQVAYGAMEQPTV